MNDSSVTLSGGREVSYTDSGDPNGPCLFFFPGAPQSRLRILMLENEFAAQGLRVISPDRPGYGKSTPQRGRSMADWPVDVAAVADTLGIERFAVSGHSSGGPYAVACGALLPDRVSAGAVVAGVTDMAWAGAWDGYPEFEVPMMRLPDEDAAIKWCAEHFGDDGRALIEEFGLTEGDPRHTAMVEAFRQGVVGYGQDIFVQGRGWPFDPGRIAVPFDVVHGEVDDFMPVAHSRHSAELIPGSSFRLLPKHDHFTVLSELPTIAAALMR
ncbi:MAG TPA: alpha/beta hydrolase [Actinomycetota bacterium]|jgi:pimeloyl-ACP methyl ester carboxylesterase|nr:alpha/beta hydrolase [Actinomycetota bacterium]